MQHKADSINIVLAGGAGQGIQAIESILVDGIRRSGHHVFATKEYMSRVRGGMNSTSIRMSGKPVSAYSERIDILIALDRGAIPHLGARVGAGTLVLGDRERIGHEGMIDVSFERVAAEAGSPLYANSVAVGVIGGLFGLDPDALSGAIGSYFGSKSDEVRAMNVTACRKGGEIGRRIKAEQGVGPVERAPDTGILLSGADAISLGAIAGGCNYVCAYPMSPGTTVLSAMARYSRKLDILVEQVEDEIGVINMALGAWYAGARALVTTSGGGFSLMTEGFSLAGMIETPVVVHLAQRPGPATGLPTRTEQGDLELALHAGHGEFPRAILSPGTLEEGFRLSHLAMNLADECQIPVVILSDQYFVDSYSDAPAFDVGGMGARSAVVATGGEYSRYAITDDGISPRGVPGRGDGLVRVDSDEHDEVGYITEDLALRTRMVDKRMRKMKRVRELAVPPVLTGPREYETLVVSWGSTSPVVREALSLFDSAGMASLHFPQVFPLHESAAGLLARARKLILVEGNATGQLGDLLRLETGADFAAKILKYNGLPFSVEELSERLAASSTAGGSHG
jgi:2-oxoglutarate ferredoxin oxidoreductase subunit alpha